MDENEDTVKYNTEDTVKQNNNDADALKKKKQQVMVATSVKF